MSVRPRTVTFGMLTFMLFARCSIPPGPTPQLDAAVPDSGERDAAIDDVDAGEWIRFILHGDQIPTGVYFSLEDGGFERERIDGGFYEYRASETFRSSFVHTSAFDQFSVGNLGPLSLTVEVQDGGARACDQFAYPSSVRLGSFDVVARNASCTLALDRVPRCPGDRISGTFSALLVDRTTGATLPVTDGAFSVRLSFVSHGSPNPPGCRCIPGSSTTNPQCM